ncbi:MAG TPA: sugar phosphate nucleotidyltransferase [Acidobacteriota bacterium]|nr:sugar phosphate nucleotidyltransferase [Acidobacteriota bacterium]
MTEEIVGVILAACRGTRMFPFDSHWPKPLLPILGKPLLQHQIEMMKSVGIRTVYVVIGYLGYEIVRMLGTGESLEVRIEYIEQTEMLGIANAVGRLEPHVQKPFLLCLGDIFFVTDELPRMIEELARENTKAVLASKFEPRPEMIRRNFAIMTAEGNCVKRVIEKPRYIQNQLKGCGIYLFAPEIFDAIRRTPRTAMRDEYEITESIQIMIDDGHRVVHSEIIEDDLNLTVPQDLLNINLLELRRRGFVNYFSEPGKHLEDKLTQCVIGRDVVIGEGASLLGCVVFDHSVIPARTDLAKTIVTPERLIPCTAVEEE